MSNKKKGRFDDALRASHTQEGDSSQRYCDALATLRPNGSQNAEISVDEIVVIKRPNISVLKVTLNIFLTVSATLVVASILNEIALWFLLFYLYLRIEDVAVFFVLLYQRFAPEDLRRACVFRPSCSDYMIMSIKKYGVCAGIFNGYRRLRRCHYPNYGEDYPV